jgi:hypothetical protein
MGLGRAAALGARWAAGLVVGGLLLGVLGMPAAADQQSGLTITLGSRWHLTASTGAWNPYVVTVRNDSGTPFDGTVVLVPNQSRNGPLPPDAFPRYRSQVSVPSGTERALHVYAIEPGGGYHAELYDRAGKLVASADPDLSPRSSTAVAVLSDATSADQQIGVPLRSLSRIDTGVSRFASAQAFPTSALELSGLNGVIVDQFDTGALGQAQLQALKDFVGLGGTLIEVGGGSWRRTLLPLPAELLPMRPTGTATASLAPLAELGGLSADLPVQVVTGDVGPAATVAVSTPGGPPLVVESRYGAGSIVELTFDPLALLVDGQTTLGALLWSQAIARGLAGAQGGSQLFKMGFGPVGPGSPPTGSGPGTWVAFPGFLYQVLSDLPLGASPPFGLLVVLLIAYVALVSGASYALLKALGRRGLLWAVVPTIAVVAATAAYVVGFGTRGSDYQETQVQFQRLGPNGVVEAYSYDGVLSPRRGDVHVTVASNALVSTAILVFGSGPNGGRDTSITPGPRPEVLFSNVPVWDVRPVQTLTIGHPDGSAAGPGMPVDVQLRLEGGRLKGQVVNHTSRTVRELQLLSSTGMQAQLTGVLTPGASVQIDVQPSQGGAPGLPFVRAPIVVGGAIGPGPQPPQTARQALLALAASEATGRPGDLALVGFTYPIDTLRVEGGRPQRTGPALVVEPVRLRSATSVGQIPPPTRLVSSFSAKNGSLIDVYELALPQGLTGHVGLNPVLAPGIQQGPAAAELYDWDLGTWRSPSPGAGGGPAAAVPLTAGETSHGVVRIRVHESAPGLAQLSLADLP